MEVVGMHVYVRTLLILLSGAVHVVNAGTGIGG